MRHAPLLALVLAAAPAAAQTIAPRDGWAIHASQKSYADLVAAVKAAAPTHGLGVVTEAGPTETARSRGIEIPGNRVIGLFNNDYAVRILDLSTAAMIEAPIRVYVTEAADGTATLAYKTPSFVLAPYADEGGPALAAIAVQLDTDFAAVASDALD
ncbi:MAG: DUF302 domain-containing protein [Rhodobacteraceae bacterium]|nr:DUF302 domain-containing protein [Paracoccaceae bacterium]